MIDARVTDIRAGDWDKWSTQHAADVIVQASNTHTLSGRVALLAWGKAFPPIDSFALSDIQVSGEGNLAYATTAYALKLKGLPWDRGKELLVFRRGSRGQWEVVAFSLSSDLPLPTR
jgi:ketosteroid isomerase-like protein